MTITRIATALASFFSVVAPASAEIRINVKAAGYTNSDAITALDLFRRNCRPLGDEFWDDIVDAEVEITEETAPYRLQRGWKTNIHLALKYSETPLHGPSFASGAGVLAGHTLHYDIGGGLTPGFLASKRSSQYLCGLSYDDRGNDVFVPVPEFSSLDK